MGSGGRAEDDLSTQYLQIVKTNNQLRSQAGAAHHAQEEYRQMLQFYCATLMNNDISGQPTA